jgi:hypothetical protein
MAAFMGKKLTGSLLNLLEGTAFEHAVFLTYSIDLPFFERSAVRHLLRKKCNNIAVFADAAHVTNELARLAEPVWSSRNWMFGRDYSLTQIRHTSAFHPKVALLVGEDIELLVGSGNLEPGGLRANLEIFHQISCSRNGTTNSDARCLITQAWNYIFQQVATRIPSVVKEQLRKVEEFIPWISEIEAGGEHVRLVTGPGSHVVDILQKEVGKDEVRELVILSPFFDAKLEVLRRLVVRLRPQRTALLIQPETISLPGNQLTGIRNLDLYALQDLESRYAHAKIIIAECASKSILLAGSHNVSTLALDGHNFEVSLLRVESSPYRFSRELGLAEHIKAANRIDPGLTLLVMRRREQAPGGQSKAWLVAAQLDGSWVEVTTHRLLESTSRLVPFQRGRMLPPLRAVPTVAEHSLKFPVMDFAVASQWTAVSVQEGSTCSAPVPLIHVKDLVERGSSTGENRIRAFISSGHLDISSLPDLLKEFGALLMTDNAVGEPSRRGHRVSPARAREAALQVEPKHLQYEDFVIPWDPLPKGATSADHLVSGLELIVTALAHAAGGTRRAIQQPREVTKPADDDDAALADRSVYAEEALAGGRLEEDERAVTDLEYEPSNDQINTGVDLSAKFELSPRKREAGGKAKLKGARQIRKHLISFAAEFPNFIEYRCEQQTPIDLIDKITVAGRLMTSLVGRKEATQNEVVELLEWMSWCEFHIALLDAMTSDQASLMMRFSWERSTLDYHRRIIERFVGYLAALQALCHCHARYVDPEFGALILIGVLRICRFLGVDRGLMREEVVNADARAVFDTMTPDFNPPVVDWPEWVNQVTQIRDADLRLRSQFRNTLDIVKSAAGASRLTQGDWVWRPQIEGHVAIVTRTYGSEVNIAWEPKKRAEVESSLLIRISDAA